MTLIERVETQFPSAAGQCAATVFLPRETGPRPVVVLAAGLGGIRRFIDNYAERFAAAGLVALTFDHRHWGDSAGEPRQLVSLRGQLRDWRSAIRFAREHPRVAPEHVALWGSSLSGGHVQHLAARDHTIAACIAQVPFALGLPTALAGGPGHAARIIVAAWRDLARQATRREPYRVELFGAPGSDAVMATAEAHAALATLLPPTSQWEQLHYTNSVPARSVSALPLYNPGLTAHRIRCPILYQIGERDTVTPPGPARWAARRAPRAELREYPINHFEVYQSPAFDRAVEDQISFLTQHLVA